MQDVTSLHHEAMEWVDRAVLARRQGDRDSMLQCTKTAFSKERSAADLVAPQFDLEPTRSVLHRSAAVLAIECGLLREAEQLIGCDLDLIRLKGDRKTILVELIPELTPTSRR